MAKGTIENLKPITTAEEARTKGRNGGIKSGQSKRRKKELKQRLKVLMEMPADPKLAKALEKTGVTVDDNLDLVLASMMKGVLKGDVRMIDRVLELIEQSPNAKAKIELQKLERRKAELEAERLELENEKNRLWLDNAKGVNQDELPDDGFLDALKGTAEEDWTDEII